MRLSSETTSVLRAMSVMRRLILLCFQNEEPTGQFSRNLSSVSHVVQSTPLWFQLKLFMNQLAAVIQLEANIIGQQLWIGSIFARPCCKRGLPHGGARTSCHSSPNASAAGCGAADVIREEGAQLFPVVVSNQRGPPRPTREEAEENNGKRKPSHFLTSAVGQF